MVKKLTFIHTADLHQGFDFSERKWKLGIKQRSDDFLNSFNIIMDHALEDTIDFVVLAGDIFNRSHPPPIIRRIVLEKLCKVSLKKPVLIIPGNHDKSRINKGLLFLYPNLHIFNSSTTHEISIKDILISITAIPFIKDNTIETVQKIIAFNRKETNFNLLILHELIESSLVGFMNFEFKKHMKGVIPIEVIDKKFDYIAVGHVHKYQKIKNAQTPIYYSGSVERTSVVERDEEKGYIVINVEISNDYTNKTITQHFIPLPARPIIYYKFASIIDLDLELLFKDLRDKLQLHVITPLILVSINSLDDYGKYKRLREFLKNLKTDQLIFEFNLSSPDFTAKIQKLELAQTLKSAS